MYIFTLDLSLASDCLDALQLFAMCSFAGGVYNGFLCIGWIVSSLVGWQGRSDMM